MEEFFRDASFFPRYKGIQLPGDECSRKKNLIDSGYTFFYIHVRSYNGFSYVQRERSVTRYHQRALLSAVIKGHSFCCSYFINVRIHTYARV